MRLIYFYHKVKLKLDIEEKNQLVLVVIEMMGLWMLKIIIPQIHMKKVLIDIHLENIFLHKIWR